jgi:ComF family protein
MERVWAGLIDLVYPPRCVACGAAGGYLCLRCLEQCARVGPLLCRRCGEPADTGSGASARVAGTTCAACLRCPPDFDLARSLFVYDGPIREAVHALKYRGRRAVAACLGRLLAESESDATIAGVTCVVPVPLHPGRLVTRGFNQAELLARPLAARLGVRCLTHALRRVRQEQSQTTLQARARRANVEHAFVPGAVTAAGTVLLVDDVFSTGATASACARVLLDGGAEQVRVLTLARAVLRPAGVHQRGKATPPAAL